MGKCKSPVEWELETRNLPPGHIDKKAAKKAVDEEYKESRKAERSVKLPNRLLSLKEAEKVGLKIWNAFGCMRLIRFYKTDKGYNYCRGRGIHLWEKVDIGTLLHELAHAIVYQERLKGVHDQDFLWVVKMVREYTRDNWKSLF